MPANNGDLTERTGSVVDVRPPGSPFEPKDKPKVTVRFDQQGTLEDEQTHQLKTFFANNLALNKKDDVYYVDLPDLPVEAPFDAKVVRKRGR